MKPQRDTDLGAIPWMSATDISASVRAGRWRIGDIAETMIDRIERVNPQLNAIVAFDPAQVRRDAARLDAERASGEVLRALHGVPFTIKDGTAVSGLPLTTGLTPFQDVISDRSAVVVERMVAAGGLFLGKTNMPESGYYGGTDNHLFGPTHNPWRHEHSAGGSSGGAAAAVAAGLGPIAEGSDGAGSVRIPAALCGVVGFKPSTGRIPQTILGGRFYEWLHHGPITRTVADAALLMDVMAGPDPRDPLSLPDTVDYSAAVRDADIAGLRVAWSEDLGLGYVDPEVVEVCRAAVQALARAGALVEEATPDWGDLETAMWQGIWVPGFASLHDLLDWPSLRGQVDDNLIDLVAEGALLTGVEIGRADLVRGLMWDAFSTFMQGYDVLVSPTLASPTFPLSQFAPAWLKGETLQRRVLGWLLTYPYNMTTTPAATVPAGFTDDGRPIGLQIAGGLHQDAVVLRAAAAYERQRPWAHRVPDGLA